MRAIHLFVTVLGLALILCSWSERSRMRQYGATVKQVQTSAVRKEEQRLRYLRKLNVTVTEYPSMQAVVSELDAVSGLERGWWLVFGIGAAVSVAGLSGLVRWECLRKRQAANNPLQPTAATSSASSATDGANISPTATPTAGGCG